MAQAAERPEVAAGDLLRLEDQVCFALSVAARGIVAVYRPLLEPLGLTHPQYLVMLALWEDSPQSAAELSDLLRLEPSTLSPLVRRLERSGYVRRERSARDGRVLLVSLTEAGRRLRAQAEGIPHRVIEHLGVEVEELAALRERLLGVAGLSAAARGLPSPPD